MTIGEIIPVQEYDYLIHVHDSKFKVKWGVDGTTVYETSSLTDALPAFEYCRDNMGTVGGMTKVKPRPSSYYPFSGPLTFEANTHHKQKWLGSGDWMASNTRLLASNNTPILSFSSESGSYSDSFMGFYLSHAQSGYSSSLVYILDWAVDLSFRDIYGSDNGMYKGNLFGMQCLDNTAPLPSQYKLSFENINAWGLENIFWVDNQVPVVGSNNSMTSWIFDKIFAWNCKRVILVQGASTAMFLAPHFSNIFYQYSAANPPTTGDAIYDFGDDIQSWLMKMVNCTTWDFPVGVNMINVGPSCEIQALNCNASHRVGGSGASKFKALDYYSWMKGESNQSATQTTDYIITHNLGIIPKHIDLTVKVNDTNCIIPWVIPENLITTTQFKVRFARAPPLPNIAGAQNLKFAWRVFI